MKIGRETDLGIQGFRNLGIEGILSLLIYCEAEGLIPRRLRR